MRVMNPPHQTCSASIRYRLLLMLLFLLALLAILVVPARPALGQEGTCEDPVLCAVVSETMAELGISNYTLNGMPACMDRDDHAGPDVIGSVNSISVPACGDLKYGLQLQINPRPWQQFSALPGQQVTIGSVSAKRYYGDLYFDLGVYRMIVKFTPNEDCLANSDDVLRMGETFYAVAMQHDLDTFDNCRCEPDPACKDGRSVNNCFLYYNGQTGEFQKNYLNGTDCPNGCNEATGLCNDAGADLCQPDSCADKQDPVCYQGNSVSGVMCDPADGVCRYHYETPCDSSGCNEATGLCYQDLAAAMPLDPNQDQPSGTTPGSAPAGDGGDVASVPGSDPGSSGDSSGSTSGDQDQAGSVPDSQSGGQNQDTGTDTSSSAGALLGALAVIAGGGVAALGVAGGGTYFALRAMRNRRRKLEKPIEIPDQEPQVQKQVYRLTTSAGSQTLQSSSGQGVSVQVQAWVMGEAGQWVPASGVPLAVSNPPNLRVSPQGPSNIAPQTYTLTADKPGQYAVTVKSASPDKVCQTLVKLVVKPKPYQLMVSPSVLELKPGEKADIQVSLWRQSESGSAPVKNANLSVSMLTIAPEPRIQLHQRPAESGLRTTIEIAPQDFQQMEEFRLQARATLAGGETLTEEITLRVKPELPEHQLYISPRPIELEIGRPVELTVEALKPDPRGRLMVDEDVTISLIPPAGLEVKPSAATGQVKSTLSSLPEMVPGEYRLQVLGSGLDFELEEAVPIQVVHRSYQVVADTEALTLTPGASATLAITAQIADHENNVVEAEKVQLSLDMAFQRDPRISIETQQTGGVLDCIVTAEGEFEPQEQFTLVAYAQFPNGESASVNVSLTVEAGLELLAWVIDGHSTQPMEWRRYQAYELPANELVADGRDGLLVLTQLQLDTGTEQQVRMADSGRFTKTEFQVPDSLAGALEVAVESLVFQDTGGVLFKVRSAQPLLNDGDLPAEIPVKLDLEFQLGKNGQRFTKQLELTVRTLYLKLWVRPGAERGTSDALAFCCLAPNSRRPVSQLPLQIRVTSSGTATLSPADDQQVQATDQKGLAHWVLKYKDLTWENHRQARFWVWCGPRDQSGEVNWATNVLIDVGRNVGDLLVHLNVCKNDPDLKLDNPHYPSSDSWLVDHAVPDSFSGPVWNGVVLTFMKLGAAVVGKTFDGARKINAEGRMPTMWFGRLKEKELEGWIGSEGKFDELYEAWGSKSWAQAAGYFERWTCSSYSERITNWIIKRRFVTHPERMNGIECSNFKMLMIPSYHVFAGIHLSGSTPLHDPRFIDPWWRQEWSDPDNEHLTVEGLMSKWGERLRFLAVMAVGLPVYFAILLKLLIYLGLSGITSATLYILFGYETMTIPEVFFLSECDESNDKQIVGDRYEAAPWNWKQALVEQLPAETPLVSDSGKK